MLRHTKNCRQGFTLIELAIVLTIAGLLFVGLWRLLASGNTQIRDQSVANQQQQLISAVKAYLGANPDTWLQNLPAAGTAKTLLLPPGVNNPVTPGLASFLPAGFISTTPNAYGQTYQVQVVRNDNTTPPTTIPSSYSFMITTNGGDVIPDAYGARIAASIGNDGGFIYSGNVCGGPPTSSWACGAYGTWAVNAVGSYGPWAVAPAAGHVASRTFVSPTADNLAPWLERNLTLPDTNFSLNTMTTNLFMGTVPATGAPTNVYLSPFTAANPNIPYVNFQAAGGGNLYMQGGTITGVGTSNISMVNLAAAPANNPQINIASGCLQTSPGFPVACPYSFQVTGDASVSNLLQANAFYALNFNYTASDIRFKTNIRPIVDALEGIMKLKPVTYTLKSSGEENLGLIAQDLEKVYPQLVSKGEGMKYVSYDGLIAPLIGAVQELKEENNNLRKQLDDQQHRQDMLEREMRDLRPKAIP